MNLSLVIDMNLSPELKRHEEELEAGALVTVDAKSSRVRILPL